MTGGTFLFGLTLIAALPSLANFTYARSLRSQAE
jgi:hypothetical protein